MEKISRSLHRRQSSTSSLSKSMLKLHSFSRSAVYDDMFAAHSLSGARNLSSIAEDYNEIFNSSRAFRSSSIPFIDLPPQAIDRTCAVEYSHIFGTSNDSDIGLSYQQLFAAAEKDECTSKNPWITEEPLFPQSDPFISLDKSDDMSCESVHPPYHSEKQFNVSYHKTIQENKNGVSGKAHIAHLHAVPGFTCIIDDTIILQSTRSKKEAPINSEDQNRVVSHSSFSDGASEDDGEMQDGHPFEVTPLSKTCTCFGGDDNNSEHLRSLNSEPCKQDPVSCSYPCSDDEVDTNSEAAASAAALRKAIKEAQVKIRVVKELMKRKNEGSESSSRTNFRDPIKSRVTVCNATEGDELLYKNTTGISIENESRERMDVESIDYVMQRLKSDMISVDGSEFEQLNDKNGNMKLASEVYKDIKMEGMNDTIQISPPIIELNKEKKAEDNQCAHTEPVPELHVEKVLEERESEQEEHNLELITTTSYMKETEPVQPCKMEQYFLLLKPLRVPGLLDDMNTNVNATDPMVATVPDKVKNFEEFVERGNFMVELECGESEKEQEMMFERCENSNDTALSEKEEPENSFHDCEDNLGNSQFGESPTFSHDDGENMDGILDLSCDDINSELFEMVNSPEVTLENLVLGEVADEGNYNLLSENPTLEDMDATLPNKGESENCFGDYEDKLGISKLDEASTDQHDDRIIDGSSNPSSDDTDSELLEVIKSPEFTQENTTLEEVTEEASLNMPTENSAFEEIGAGVLRKKHDSVCEIRRNIDEDSIRRRQAAKDREAVRRAIREARERAFLEARERVAMQRATPEVQKRMGTETQTNAKMKLPTALNAKIRAERAAVERATAEARQRALQKAVSGKFASQTREPCGAKENISSPHQDSRPSDPSTSSTYSFSFNHKGFRAANAESELRVRARLERHQRTAERAAKALAEKDMRDLLAQREQAQRNRLAETLDADVKRWSSGKQGNLRALLSTLQYILGLDSSWQPIPLTDIVTSDAVRKAYRKATLCVHPDKLQQRGASIQQKYVCEKVFDLLKVHYYGPALMNHVTELNLVSSLFPGCMEQVQLRGKVILSLPPSFVLTRYMCA